MIKVKVINEFTFARYNEIKNLESKDRVEDKRLFVGDIFECDKEICDYLMGKNPANMKVIDIIEIIPEQVEEKQEIKEIEKEPIKEEKPIKKIIKKKNGKK